MNAIITPRNLFEELNLRINVFSDMIYMINLENKSSKWVTIINEGIIINCIDNLVKPQTMKCTHSSKYNIDSLQCTLCMYKWVYKAHCTLYNVKVTVYIVQHIQTVYFLGGGWSEGSVLTGLFCIPFSMILFRHCPNSSIIAFSMVSMLK